MRQEIRLSAIRLNGFIATAFLALSLFLTACTDTKPTAVPTAVPTATPQAPAPLAYLSEVEFKFSDQAEKAHRDLVSSQPALPAYASRTAGSHWFVLARDSNSGRLKDLTGKDARISPVTYFGEALGAGVTSQGSYPAYVMSLDRTTVDVRTGGAKEAARLLFARATNQLQLRAGTLIFTVGDDQIYAIVPGTVPAERVLPLASMGKLELVSAGEKSLPDDTTVTTSASPPLGDLRPQNTTVYSTLAENQDFASLKASPAPGLAFELRNSSRLYEYTRANVGKYTALVFDRQVVSSNQVAGAVRDKGQFIVPRWSTPGGVEDMQRFVNLLNANPPQVFETKSINRSPSFVFSGSFTR